MNAFLAMNRIFSVLAAAIKSLLLAFNGCMNRGIQAPRSFFLLGIEKNAVLYECALLMLFLKTLFVNSNTLGFISNHGIMSLDIIYMSSLILLIMFYRIKDPGNPLFLSFR